MADWYWDNYKYTYCCPRCRMPAMSFKIYSDHVKDHPEISPWDKPSFMKECPCCGLKMENE